MPFHESKRPAILQDWHLLIAVQKLENLEKLSDWGYRCDVAETMAVADVVVSEKSINYLERCQVHVLKLMLQAGNLDNLEPIFDASKQGIILGTDVDRWHR